MKNNSAAEYFKDAATRTQLKLWALVFDQWRERVEQEPWLSIQAKCLRCGAQDFVRPAKYGPLRRDAPPTICQCPSFYATFGRPNGNENQ